MVTILNAPRYELERFVRMFGYSDKEIRTFSMRDLRECIWNNSDQQPDDWDNFRADDL
jgi:hypothetical protein